MNIFEKPMISCLCVTWGRPALLERSIALFNKQTYSNKQLVVVCRSEDTATLKLLYQTNQKNIKIVPVLNAGQRKLGELRNFSIENSDGEYVCQWDDDDWYHPERINSQYTAIVESGKRGSILSFILMFDVNKKNAYLSTRSTWENSFMCERRILDEKGIKFPALNRAEDTAFINELLSLNALVPLVRPELYIYNNTGANTCDPAHFEIQYKWAQKLSNYHSNVVSRLVLDHSENDIKELSSRRFVHDYRLVQKLPEGFDSFFSRITG